MPDELRCPHCGESNPAMLEALRKPLWAKGGPQRYFCEVCGKEFLHVPDRGST